MSVKKDDNTSVFRTFLALGAGSLLASFARQWLGLPDAVPPEQDNSRGLWKQPLQGQQLKRTPTTTVPAPKRR